MIKTYEYLSDDSFLYLMDNQKVQKQFAKITLLNWDETPITEIQGLITSGTESLNGNSAVRRTANLNMIVNKENTKITDINNLISINKKIFLEIGIENKTKQYTEYPIIWYPQGTFVITGCSSSHNTNGISLSLNFKDKMCLLNGECGGTIPASTQLDTYDAVDENGKMVTKKPLISQIIRELVNHFGNEQLGKIIITDIDDRVKVVMKWIGDSPVYLYWDEIVGGETSYGLTTNYEEAISHADQQMFEYGDDIGFIYTDFTYPTELIANPGDSVVTQLDKIKNTLGNFEYFYDIYGNFRFQEIKNYLNTSHAKVVLDELQKEDYLIDMEKGKVMYDFTNSPLLINFSNSPQYNKIKNDFVVWGTRKNNNGNSVPIRYHLAIDTKPAIGNIYSCFFYLDPNDNLEKAKVPLAFDNKNNFPKQGKEEIFYLDKSTNCIYKWDGIKQTYLLINGAEILEFSSIEDFPEKGAINKVYLDLSTNKKYVWDKNTTSLHYLEIQQEKQNLLSEYIENKNTIQENINNCDLEINRITEILETWGTEAKVEGEITSLENNISFLESKISMLEDSIAIWTEEAETETDPNKKTILLNKIIAARDAIAQYRIINTNNEERIAELQEYLENRPGLVEDLQEQEDLKESYEEELQTLKETYNEEYSSLLDNEYEYIETELTSLVKVKTTDWRSELYLQGAVAEPLGVESNYYYAELAAEWPKLYNLKANSYTEAGETIYTGAFYPEVLAHPENIDYFLDFIDSEALISKLNVNNIGRRSKIESKDTYNCVFEPEIPDFVLIESGQEDTAKKRQECESRGQKYIQVASNIFKCLAYGGSLNGCYTEIKNLLYSDTQYNESIQIQGIPVFHLEPNIRVKIMDINSDINGEYMISSISLPLAINGTMSISATKAISKL